MRIVSNIASAVFSIALLMPGIAATGEQAVATHLPYWGHTTSDLHRRSLPASQIPSPQPLLKQELARANQAGPSLAGSLPGPAKSIDDFTTGALAKSVFNSYAIPVGVLPASARWRSIYGSLDGAWPKRCNERSACSALEIRMGDATAEAAKLSFAKKLRLINSAVNQNIAYSSDRESFGRVDYWAGPQETVEKGSGDCEDMAILKLALLKSAGIPTRSMSIVVLRDHRRNLFHAVLSVATDQGHFILDNAHDAILPDTAISRYQPLFSMSEERSWIHGVKRSGAARVAGHIDFATAAPGESAAALGGAPSSGIQEEQNQPGAM